MTHQIILHDFTSGGRKVAPHNTVPRVLRGASYSINPFRTKTPKYLFPSRNKPLLYHQLATEISLFSLQISKTYILCRQNKIWTFGNPI